MPTAGISRPTVDTWVQPAIDFFCETHLCVSVCVHSSNWSANPQVFKVIKASMTCSTPGMCVFRNTHVYAHSRNWSANPWLFGATLNCFLLRHACVCVLTAAIGLPKLLNVQNRHLTSSLIFLRHTCVCVHSSIWVGQPSDDFFCNTCVCLLTAALGLPKSLK